MFREITKHFLGWLLGNSTYAYDDTMTRQLLVDRLPRVLFFSPSKTLGPKSIFGTVMIACAN